MLSRSKQTVEAKSLGFPRSRRTYELEGVLPDPPRLAVVGSRAAMLRDRPGVERLVQLAGARGWSLVSGGALGVDAWMHRAALRLGLPQLAVLPCERGQDYPPDHAPLFRAIVESGRSGLLYALAQGREPARHVFIARNEIVLRCCDAVVVVHSRLRSGSLWTGQRALALERPTAVFRGSEGSDRLIVDGAVDLGSVGDSDLERALEAFLAGRPLLRSKAWPGQLAALEHRFKARPGSALGLEDFPEPLLAAAQLGEAAALGLIMEQAPGRYRLL